MTDFKRKEKEPFESFLRRFTMNLRKSGKLFVARGKQYKTKKKNKRQIKVSTLHSLKVRSEKEYLKKIGKIKER